MDSVKKHNKVVLMVFLLILTLLQPVFAEKGNSLKNFIKKSTSNLKFKNSRVINKAEVLKGATVTVLPEVATKVFLSNRDVNRFTCGGNRPVKDVIYSSEKGISHSKSNDNAYVKFLVGKGGSRYTTAPSEFYILCGSEATNYTVIGIPKDIPAQHVILSAPSAKVEENIAIFKGMSFEKIITKVMKEAYLSEFPSSYTIEHLNKKIPSGFKDVSAVLKTTARIEGEGLNVKIFNLSLKNTCSKKKLNISEKNFISQRFSKAPIAITIEYQTIKKERITRLFILEQLESKNS